jgi:cytochrome c2
MMLRLCGLAVAAVLIAGAARAEPVSVTLPDLSPAAKAGGQVFVKNCSQCHGFVAGGTDKGPPLIHKIYEPSHHGDFAFFRAVKQGTRAHHWPYGDMPPQPQVSEDDVAAIVTFIREVQRANGIE